MTRAYLMHVVSTDRPLGLVRGNVSSNRQTMAGAAGRGLSG
jgi:hypothetical protein